MDTPAASMTVRDAGRGTVVIDIAGEVTSACEQELSAAYAAAGRPGISRLVLNFSQLEYMNSGGIGMLVTLLVRANRAGRELAACGLSGHYRQIFALTRLDEAITIFDDEPSALAAAVMT
ncbi:MAG: STAS domain-containing protein [Streptosporangiaceae bacterium]